MKTGSELLAELPFRWGTQGKIFIIGGLGYMFDAWDVVLPGFVLPLLAQSSWHLNSLELGIFGTIGLIGMAVGAFVWGSIADLVGRRKAFSWTVLLFALFSLLSAVAPSYTWLLIFRFISGFGLGGCVPVDYSVVAEFMPKKNRGTMLTLMDVWWPIGATLNGLLASALLPFHNWRVLFLIMVVPALLVFWIRRGIPESPLYLVQSGRRAEADDILSRLAKRTGVTLPATWSWSEKEEKVKVQWLGFITKFRDIWTYSWKITLSVWLIFLSNLLLYYGVLIWLPSILVHQGYSDYKAYLAATVMTAIGVIGTLLAAWLVEAWGRKPVIVIGGILAGLSMVGFGYQIHSHTAAYIWILVFGLTSEIVIPALYAYAPEVYPTRIRGTGFGWASALSRVGSGFVPAIFGSILWPIFGLANTFLAMTIFITISVLFMSIFAPETRGTALDEVIVNASPKPQTNYEG
ncbi:MFS transporter [Alicyclobacillus dauci]|uniref:MFS transporter n=1 Tax=Alicyclobacillus dauci TaxID=1475485 RepID=A0ABY6YZ12_9BACL|nr:MFS transporter [Alicyclobacillus dauci]WAH35216.1 MFS transporter [Alicyclobacillus dauci]